MKHVHVQSLRTARRIAGIVMGLLVCRAAASIAQPTMPSFSPNDVAGAIQSAGGPNVQGLLVEQSVDPPYNKTRREFLVYLDDQGRPISGSRGASYYLEINLSYMRDGSGGYCWSCVMFVGELSTGLYTNAGSNQMSLEEFDKLMAGRPHWEAFNDRETVRKYDATLDRTPQAAVKKAFADLNKGTTGFVRTHIRPQKK